MPAEQAKPFECDPVILPFDVWRCSFTDAIAAGISNPDFDLLTRGAGQTVSQTGGNALITTGTTINEEVIIRSKRTWEGVFTGRWKATLSQRIANNTFVFEFADLVGDNLAYTINSATSVTVTVPNFPATNTPYFTAANIGQTVTLGNIRTSAGAILTTAPPQDAVIASVSGNAITFTVTGFPASGVGTLMLYGWNSYRGTYDSTTATSMKWETRRRGYTTALGAFTCSTTASPGHFVEARTTAVNAQLSDTSGTVSTTTQFTSRAVRLENLPDSDVQLYLFIRAVNGTVAPATTTTLTVGFAGVEVVGRADTTQTQVSQPVGTVGTVVTVVQGTGTNLNAQITGAAAASAATSGNPVYTGGKVVPITPATVDTSLTAGDAGGIPLTTGNQGVNKPFGTAENDWTAIRSMTPTVWASASTLVQVRAASGTASVRTYVTGLQLESDALSAVTSLWLLDGPVAISSSTVATPGVITSGTHDFKVGDAIVLQGITSLALTGVAANQVVYVVTVPSTTTFTVALTPGGTGVQCTVTGTATCYRILKQVRFQTAALPADNLTFDTPLRTAPNVALSLLCSATTTGTIYADVNGYYGF